MFNFWVWLIEKFDLFYGFESKQILNSFANLFGFVLFFIFVISVIIFYKLFESDDDLSLGPLFFSIIVSLFVSGIITSIIYFIYIPRDPEGLIKTTQIKEEQKVIIPSEGVTEVSLKLNDSDTQLQPSTLKEGAILTLTVEVGDKEFKKEFPYKKENLKIKRGQTEKITGGTLITRSFKDELFNHERVREEEDIIIELESPDPFYNSEN
jgi:hypothetical protein